jgi:hypothetical protein
MKLSVFKIMQNDWPSLFVALGAPGIWVVYFVFPFLRPDANITTMPAIIISFLCLATLAWRILRVHWYFYSGHQTTGVLSELKIVRDRGRFEYEYQVGSESLSSWCPVHKSKQVMAYRQGDVLTVLYDPARPGRSIVKELFEKHSGEAEQPDAEVQSEGAPSD